jgi:hypothetical protein
MNISHKFLNDRPGISLLSTNIVLAFVGILSVLLRVNTSDTTTTIVQYRANLGAFAFKSGSNTYLQTFALFIFVTTSLSTVMAFKFYSHRRHLAVALLGVQAIVTILSIIISNALIAVN